MAPIFTQSVPRSRSLAGDGQAQVKRTLEQQVLLSLSYKKADATV